LLTFEQPVMVGITGCSCLESIMTSRNRSVRVAAFILVSCVLVAASACDLPTSSQARAEPDELDELYVEDIETNGKGCPKGDPNTVEVVIADDKRSFVIIYRDMELTNPPGPKSKNLNCHAAVDLHIPAGVQVTLATVNTRGYAYLDEKIEAAETSSYFFAGVPIGIYPHKTIEGPHDGFFEFSDSVPLPSPVWSACGASARFEIKTILHLNATKNPDGEAIFGAADTDVMFQTLKWQMRDCA
jgi:hypothetical protein